MLLSPTSFLKKGDPPLKVWVLIPTLHTDNAHIDYYYDFTQSREEYRKVFEILEIDWQWQPVTMLSYRQVIEQIEDEKEKRICIPVVLNLCDGDEVNGTAGISVLKLLEEKDLIYTGADEHFYAITTSKLSMKMAFDAAGVPTAAWSFMEDNYNGFDGLFGTVGKPLIVKPAVSGGSMGVGIKNVVETEAALSQLLETMFLGYQGWDLCSGGLIAEKFIAGPEYTVFISGSYNHPESACIYTPVERVFHPSLPEKERFLSFDRLWEIYEEETAMPGNENFYEYCLPDPALWDELKKLSWDAYCATKGMGYTRVDLRMDSATGKIYVLEINAQCGISEDEDFTSIGAILKFSGKTFSGLIADLLTDAFIRAAYKNDAFNSARA